VQPEGMAVDMVDEEAEEADTTAVEVDMVVRMAMTEVVMAVMANPADTTVLGTEGEGAEEVVAEVVTTNLCSGYICNERFSYTILLLYIDRQ